VENQPSIEAKTEFATQGEIVMGAVKIVDETLFIKEIPTATKGGERHCNKECKLNDRANANKSTIGDKTRINAQTFKDAISYQILDDDNSSIDSIYVEKQEDCRMYYLIYRTVTLKISLCRSYYKT
jgi:hypothetical protein